jgi:hypothetical protein
MRHSSTSLTWLLSGLLWLLSHAYAHADKSAAVDRISVWLGGYQADAEGDLRLTNASGSQTTGDQRILEGSEVIKRARIDWLLFESQGFSIDYYQFDKRDARTIGGTFSFGGVNYTATGELAARSKIDIGNISYRWWTGGEQTAFGLGVCASDLPSSRASDAEPLKS